MNFTTPMQKKNKQNVNVFCSIVSQSLRKRRMIDVKFSKQIQTNEHAGQMNINSWVSGKKIYVTSFASQCLPCKSSPSEKKN
jgi:hypothetical protein